MQRTLNYTGRRRIARGDVEISMRLELNAPPAFDVQFNIGHMGFPATARIYVEAYFRNTLQRFSFGSIDNIAPPKETSLNEIDLSGPTLFRVRVVDESESIGRLLAAAEDLKPLGADDEDNRTSLLAVRSYPLGEQTWRMDFETGGKPTLNINSRIPNAIGQIKENALFQALVLPAALREALVFFLWNEDQDSVAAEQWFGFAESIHAERPHESDPVILVNWVDDVVASFSEQFGLCNLLLQKMEAASL